MTTLTRCARQRAVITDGGEAPVCGLREHLTDASRQLPSASSTLAGNVQPYIASGSTLSAVPFFICTPLLGRRRLWAHGKFCASTTQDPGHKCCQRTRSACPFVDRVASNANEFHQFISCACFVSGERCLVIVWATARAH